MSNDAIDYAMLRSDIRGPAKAVAIVLANRANADRDFRCWPSHEDIAHCAGLSQPCVRKALKELQARGFVVVLAVGGGRDSTEYRVQYDPADHASLKREREEARRRRPDRGYHSVAPSLLQGDTQGDTEATPRVIPDGARVLPGSTKPIEPIGNLQGTHSTPPGAEAAGPVGERASARHRSASAAQRQMPLLSLVPPAAPSPAAPSRAGPSRAEAAATFEAWWSEYPRKDKKKPAKDAYVAAIKKGASSADLLLGLRRFRWPADPKFIPHARNWLRDERWTDPVADRISVGEIQAGPVAGGGHMAAAMARRRVAMRWQNADQLDGGPVIEAAGGRNQ